MTVQQHLGLFYDENEPMENDEHRINANFYLAEPLETWLAEQGRSAFVSSNSTVAFDPDWYPVGPDFYVVLGGRRKHQKRWVVRDEGGLKPNLVVEMLSPSTEDVDRGKKMVIYRDMLEVQDHVLYDSDTKRFEVYHLVRGTYVQASPDAQGHVACSTLPLRLGVYDGQLRFYTLDGMLLRTATERATAAEAKARAAQAQADDQQTKAAAAQVRADAERARADAERAVADSERMRAETAERRVRELEQRMRELNLPED